MRMLAIGAVLLASASGAGAQGVSREAAEASRLYIACQKSAAARLDDGRSDAATIGLAVVAMCSAERHNYAVVSSRGNIDVQLYTQRGLDEKAQASATAFVLAARAAKAAPAAPKAKPKPRGEAI